MDRRTLVAVLAAVSVGLLGTVPAVADDADEIEGHYQGFGDPGGFWSIVPPGQKGVFNVEEALRAQMGDRPEHTDDQLWMYANIIYDDATPGFTADDLPRFFKDGSLGVHPDAVGEVYSPGDRGDVTVIRESDFGVPHIFGETREGTMFAAGYTAAEDRLFLIDVLRHVGRAELTAFLGPSEGNREMDRDQMASAPYVEEDLTEQIELARDLHGADGERVYADAEAYVAGVNQYIIEALADWTKMPAEYYALQRTPDEFVLEDMVAIASLVGGIFGKGGGREVENLCALDELEAAFGDAGAARAVFDDMKFADDAEAPVHTDRSFPYMSHPESVDADAIPDLDCETLEPLEAPPPGLEDAPDMVIDIVPRPPLPGSNEPGGSRTGTIDFPWGSEEIVLGGGMSNALLVGGSHTDNGNPIAVFGPQTAYFMPQLLVEKGIYGPGIAARGTAFAGTDLYIQLGRGGDYAWSATSAGADNTDQFVLELCEYNDEGGDPVEDWMGYTHDGECKQIEEHHEPRIAQPSAAGLPEPPDGFGDGSAVFDAFIANRYFQRAPDYGFITARGETTGGDPIAIATARTTYLDELGSARGFMQVNDPDFMAGGVDSFRRAFRDGVDYTFNWFYVDEDDIAVQVSCWCPERHPGIDPYLPAWGSGEWDWQGSFDRGGLPWEVNPERGYLVSWNNKQAPGFRSNDGQFGWGPIHRADKLERRIAPLAGEGSVSVGEAVDVAILAATVDLRAQELLPVLFELMGDEAPGDADARAQEMYDLLVEWRSDGFGHRRDHDGDHEYDDPQAVAILDAWWEPLVDAIFAAGTQDARNVIGINLHDAPQNHLGSAFQDSMYAHVHKDLRQVLGEDVADRFHTTYCGNGDRDGCADALWGALSEAAERLEDEFGSSEVSDWRRRVSDDAIVHTPVGVVEVDDIHWQNRPSYQQVVQAPGEVDGTPDDPPSDDPPDDGPADEEEPDQEEPPAEAHQPLLPATGGGGSGAALALLAIGAALLLRRSGSRSERDG